MKDKLLLLFWGIIAGAVFVGGILSFGAFMNWMNAHTNVPISSEIFKPILGAVIVSILFLIFKIGLFFNNKITRKQAAKYFSVDLIEDIYNSSIAKAIVEQREDIIDQTRLLPQHTREEIFNAPISMQGITPLHIAAAIGRVKFCKRLIKYGAKLDVQDAQGQTPLDYAVKFNQTAVQRFLQTKQ